MHPALWQFHSYIVWKFGSALKVYDSNLKLVHTQRIHAGGQPGQICMAGKGGEYRQRDL